MWVQELGFLPLDQQSVISTKHQYPSKLSTLDQLVAMMQASNPWHGHKLAKIHR
jgi:hypothetical protein